jgi:hypothetical protein
MPGASVKTITHLVLAFLVSVQKIGLFRSISYWVAMWMIWAIETARRALPVIRWRLSPRVDLETLAARNTACETCEAAETVQVDGDTKRYCRACGCPKWKWSELTVKNQRQAHNCPLGRHAGSVATVKWDAAKKQPVGGCAGCGGSNGHKQLPNVPPIIYDPLAARNNAALVETPPGVN